MESDAGLLAAWLALWAGEGVVGALVLGATMNKACQLCRGACCESALLPLCGVDYADEWLRARGKQISPTTVEVETTCPHLIAGKCDRHGSLPKVCEVYQVGGADCVATVKRRRGNWREILEAMR